MSGEWVGAISVICIFGWIPLKVVLGHIAKMTELKGGSGANSAALQEIRGELKALRETTTRFDVSFDAALTRLEERVQSMETQSILSSYETGETNEQTTLKSEILNYGTTRMLSSL